MRTNAAGQAGPVRGADRRTRDDAVPAPRRSPEDDAHRTDAPRSDAPGPEEGYPGIRYALEHCPALRGSR